jgi:hypothetical protein
LHEAAGLGRRGRVAPHSIDSSSAALIPR